MKWGPGPDFECPEWDVIMVDQHQAITWTNVDFSLIRFCDIDLRAILQRVSKLIFCIMSLNIVHLKLLPQLNGGQCVKKYNLFFLLL